MGKLIGKTYAAPAPAAVGARCGRAAARCVRLPALRQGVQNGKGPADHIAKEHADAPVPGEE